MYIFFTQFKEENKEKTIPKRLQDKILSIPNYYRREVNENSQKSNHTNPQTINAYRADKTSNTSLSDPAQSVGWTLAIATERRVSTCQKKNTFQVAELRI